jgi:ABC-2 type transport system ATP-binding protein
VANATALEAIGLSKSYAVGFLGRTRRQALRGLSFEVQRGEVFGYLGPNGSGKTTTLKILLGLVTPDAGTATVLGSPLPDPGWRYRIGYLPEQPYFYDYLTAAEYLDYAGRLFGLPAAERREKARAVLATVGLERHADVALRRYSKGMSQRLGLAQALINDPEMVFLDEPMSGLDPIGRRLVRDLILDLKARGKTVFFCTHILSDAESLCDRVALLRGGELVRAGRLDEILTMGVSHVEVLTSGGAGLAQWLASTSLRKKVMGERFKLEVEENSLVSTLQEVVAHGGRILSVQQVRQSLEQYFFEQVGGQEVPGWDPVD